MKAEEAWEVAEAGENTELDLADNAPKQSCPPSGKNSTALSDTFHTPERW